MVGADNIDSIIDDANRRGLSKHSTVNWSQACTQLITIWHERTPNVTSDVVPERHERKHTEQIQYGRNADAVQKFVIKRNGENGVPAYSVHPRTNMTFARPNMRCCELRSPTIYI